MQIADAAVRQADEEGVPGRRVLLHRQSDLGESLGSEADQGQLTDAQWLIRIGTDQYPFWALIRGFQG